MKSSNQAHQNTAPAGYEHGQAVEITGGKYTGRKSWFNKLSGGGGQHCFIWFQGSANMSGARVLLADIQPQEQGV